jgi:peptidyl-prolyl cis-trans isomerase SurA
LNQKTFMKKFLLVVTLFQAVCLYQTSSAKPKISTNNYLLKVGQTPVSTAEFKYVYDKNNTQATDIYSEKNLREYLDLFIKFKLKVLEAEKLGLDTTKSFLAEFSGYKKQLAQPYLTEKSVTEKLVKEAYARFQEEILAGHILIKVAEDADPRDTLIAYNKTLEIRKRILNGEVFENVAKSNSDDPSAATNGGNLGYFSALQMVYPFEDGAYKTAVGQVSMPVRTKFGYHLIKVLDRRKAQGEIKVAHIMVRYNAYSNPNDSLMALKKITEIGLKLRQDTSKWNSLCNEFSEDINSRAKGGVLQPFSTGNMIPSFEEAAFKLQTPGEIGNTIQTPYGFHILKLISRKGVPAFEEVEATIKTKVSRDSRSDLSKVYLINRLKKENSFVENSKTWNYAVSKADSNLVNGKFSFDPNLKENKQVLFSLGNKKVLLNDFYNFISIKNKGKVAQSPAFYLVNLYKDYVNEYLLADEEANLEKKHEEYRMLLKEYKEGILLFVLMDKKVWSKAIEDTTGLKTFYETNKNNYTWKKRLDATIYNCKDQLTLDLVKKSIANPYFDLKEEKADKIIFDKDKSAIKPAEIKKADAILIVLNRDKNYKVEIQTAENKGEVKGVGIKRAEELKKYLVAKGIDPERIVINNKKLMGKALLIQFKTTSMKDFEKQLNQAAPLTLVTKVGKFQQEDEAILSLFEWKIEPVELNKNGRFYLIIPKSIIPAQPKTLEEAKGSHVSDYQTYLEKSWLESLVKSNAVEINENELKKLIKK